MKNKYIYITLIVIAIVNSVLMSSCEMEEDFEKDVPTTPEIMVTGFSPKEGYAGSTVTITGSEFGEYSQAAKIYFNGVLAEDITSYTNSEIQVVVPGDAVTGKLLVNVWTHNVETSEDFEVLPGMEIDGISPNKAAAGEEVIITGQNFGSDINDVTVYFQEGVEAEIISINDNKIIVKVPIGGESGVITIAKGIQELNGPEFFYPVIVQHYFDTDGDSEGWYINNYGYGATYNVSGGSFNVDYDMSQATYNRANLIYDNLQVDPGEYPILAIRWTNAPTRTFQLHCNLGTHNNDKSGGNHDGVLDGNVYYYDLTKGFNGTNFLSLTEPTTLDYLQWKVTENVSTGLPGYSVDWILNFKSVEELEEYLANN
ncbi:IPT/TIG domain-containing protein [Saccharicrinis sp. 156]|uniref:IPT/TIG domain-containing protein n=1 Tax=Saccharicrinis sp. 156 TaxID=3417574 RepID=UPI003D33CAD3